MKHNIEVILFEPQIPQNTGNILRTCSVTGSALTLVHPLGFTINDRWLKRAGLDYWDEVIVGECDDLKGYLESGDRPSVFFTSKGKKLHYEIEYQEDVRIIFGSETEGLPAWVHEEHPDRCVRIPMIPGARCLNLATSVGVGLYEALRQTTGPMRRPQAARAAEGL